MLVSDYMSATPVTVQQEDNYDLAFEIMEEKNMHHLPVIGDDMHVAGMLTETDLFRALTDLLDR